MRISDWSSDVCSSDLPSQLRARPGPPRCVRGWTHDDRRRRRSAGRSRGDGGVDMTSRIDVRQALRSLGALLALGCLLIGVPAALATAVGWPLPSEVPPLDRVVDALGGSSIDDRTIVKGLALVCWLAWAQILLSTVVEIAAWHTGRVASRLPAVPLQALTRRLVLSALLLGASVQIGRAH